MLKVKKYGKGIICFFIVFSMGTALAYNSKNIRGFYLGVLVGATWVDYSQHIFPQNELPAQIRDAGVGPSYAVGYAINSMLAFEIGAIYPRKPKFISLHQSNTSARFKNNVTYLAPRLSYAISHACRIFMKVGVGYVVRDNVADQEVLLIDGAAVTRPVYGLGLTYQIRRHWELECAWMQAASSAQNSLPATNFFGIGANYLF